MGYLVCIEAENASTTNRNVSANPNASNGQVLEGFGNAFEFATYDFTGVVAGNYELEIAYTNGSPGTCTLPVIIDGGAAQVVTLNFTGFGGSNTPAVVTLSGIVLSAGTHTIRVQGDESGSPVLDKFCLKQLIAPTAPVAPPVAPPTAPVAPPTSPTAPPSAPVLPTEFDLEFSGKTNRRDECTGECIVQICFKKKAGDVIGRLNNATLYKSPDLTKVGPVKVLINGAVCFDVPAAATSIGDEYVCKVEACAC